MHIRVQQGQITEIEASVLVVPGFDAESPRDQALDAATGGWLEEVYASGEFATRAGEFALLHRPAGMKAQRFLLAGAGSPAKFNEAEARKLAGAALRYAKSRALRDIVFVLPEQFASAAYVQAAAEGAVTADFEPDQLKTDPKKNDKVVNSFAIVAAAELASAAEIGRIIGESQNFARILVNEPANILTPLVLAARAAAMAAEVGLACEILDLAKMTELKMGALLGVAQGSDNPPALIVIRYEPAPGTATSTDHLALVGKGVTFDTGGISIKPADGMEKMKYDMGGAAAVLGAMRAIAQLKPSVRVTAFVPTVENMLSGNAQRPGDIVTTMLGKTVEVLNTDAEGRLILADALTYAIRQGATHLVDAATLTGAIAVALGHLYFGAFTNDDAFYDKLLAATKTAGERMWRLPMDDDYKDYLKNAFADMGNIGGRWGGAITAAKFLEEFVEGKPWVHLDIAGTAWHDEAKAHLAKGPTGVPVRSMVALAMGW